jgi:hypothetical protein
MGRYLLVGSAVVIVILERDEERSDHIKPKLFGISYLPALPSGV